MGKKRHDVNKPEEKNDDFKLEDVLELGGDKDDFELLKNVETQDEAFELKEDFESEPVKKDDIRDLIQQLGFSEIMEYTEEGGNNDEKPQKKKLLARPLTEEEKSDQQQKVSQEQKKKNKNKFKLQDDEISSTTISKDLDFLKLPVQTRKFLLVKTGGKWFDHSFLSDPAPKGKLAEEKLKALEKYAAQLFGAEVALYKKQQDNKKSSNVTWIKTVLTSGTLSDKIAALTLLIQDAPVHCLGSLETMIGMAQKKGKREALMALDTLKDLFLNDLLLEKKLKTFDQHPLLTVEELASGNKDSRDRRLLMWYYEHLLKEKYASFVKAVEAIAHDTVAAAKKKAIATTFELLSSNPEQEKMLLTNLVNKLGDPDYKVASKAAHLLTKLVQKHPNMKFVIVLEVERLLYRPNISVKAQYYGACFLNQLILSNSEKELASRLIAIYFSFFKSFVKQGEVDSKMLSCLLTGVNRAYPYAKVDKEKMEESMETLYKIVHIVNFNTSVHALMLLYQVMDSSDNISDRYYTALYKKILDPELQTSSKQAMFLNLLFKSMKKDLAEKRIKAFIKRLLQICCHQTPTFICGALILLSEVIKTKGDLMNLTQVAIESDDEEEHFTDVKCDSDVEESMEEQMQQTKGSAVDTLEKRTEDVELALSHKGHVTAPSWIHRRNIGSRSDTANYDPSHRNPLYAQAEGEASWELLQLSRHFHPSVALFAFNLLQGRSISYTGDPLEDFTLIRFLDRFVFRNPKKKSGDKDDMQTLNKMASKHKRYTPEGARAFAVNSDEYLQKDEDSIPVDELFFYRFFKKEAVKSKGKRVEDFDSDAESVDDEEFDAFLAGHEAGLAEDEDEFHMDFAGELSKAKAKQKEKRKKTGDSEDEDNEDSDDLELTDEEIDFEDDEELKAAFEDDDDFDDEGSLDEENIDFSDEDELDDFDFKGSKKSKTGKRQLDKVGDDDEDMMGLPVKKSKKRKGENTASLFAAAEEFAHLIDDNVGSKIDTVGSNAVFNKDKSDVKQLNWEAKREQWMQGKDWRSKKKGLKKGPFKKKQGGRRK